MILDTNVYIDHWEQGLHGEVLAEVRREFVVRHSAVVLSELRRGARSRRAQRLVESLYRIASVIWEPTSRDWWEAARLIRELGDDQGWDRAKRREFQNDALIALTARRQGAAVVTDNEGDFRLLAKRLRIVVIAVREPPDPAGRA